MNWLPLLVIAFSLGSQEPVVTGKPELTHVGMAAPDVIVLTIQAQSIEYGKQVPYVSRPGDEIEAQSQHRYIKRDGNLIGALVGSEGKIMLAPDRVLGDPLDTKAADQAGAYRITADADADGVVPQAVFRKSKPLNVTRAPAKQAFGMEHTIMLKTAAPLEVGKRYTVRFKQGVLAEDEKAFVFDPAQLRSEAVHANQIGFRPDDPVKLAFLSFWMGTGGNLEYPAEKAFHVLDDKTGEVVFSGKASLSKRASDKGNKTLADIHELDFSAFRKPGVYRVSVEGVGCSFPFEIGADVWKKAFVKSMRGLYCQHSGIELGPPYTTFVRPRGFHPADGVKVYVSEDKRAGTGEQTMNRFQALVANKTDQVLPDAWGGYMDAGDWDRRQDHALMTLLMFDLAEMFPDTFAQWNFNIPASKDDLPDLVNEALWEVDFLRRMQQEDGSVFGAIESGEHPKRGEGSWQESLPVMAYGRTPGVAYNYTSDAARAAFWFQTHKDPEKAQGYQDSAQKAFEWAERQQGAGGKGNAVDARCLAAAELYRLTGDKKWDEIFLAATRFKSADAPFFKTGSGQYVNDAQSFAAWTYLRTDHRGINKAIQQNIRHALLRDADRDVGHCEATDFHWAGGPGRVIQWGALSVPESSTLVRAHFITGDEKYLRAIVLSTLSGSGANPVNMCYTTGVGSRWPQHLLHEDARISNQPLYEGVTIGGPIEAAAVPQNVNWYKNRVFVEPLLYPPVKEWPPTESYFDVFTYVPMNEFTVHQTMLPASFVWGYLAAREQAGQSSP